MEYVASLTFDEEPNYEKCRSILREGLKKRGYKDDGKMVFKAATPKSTSKTIPPKLDGRKVGCRRKIQEEDEFVGETLASSSPKRMKTRSVEQSVDIAPTIVGEVKAKGKVNISPKKNVSRKILSSKAKKSPVNSQKMNSKRKTTKESSIKKKQTSDNIASSSKRGKKTSMDSPNSPEVMCLEETAGSASQKAKSVTPKQTLKPGSQKKLKQGRARALGSLCNGNASSRKTPAVVNNPTPHMLALMKKLNKEY